ncbi:MAG: hypothetical protein H7255_11535 [Ramlibacter sp.]|nr:hypothetical protein [Ramlibacter sp.]
MTKFSKGIGGFKAEDMIDIGGGRAVKMLTSKFSSGKLQTVAHGVQPTEQGFVWLPFSDFSERIESSALRCTEKNVMAQHAAAMAKIEEIKARAIAFYKLEAVAA